MCGYENTTLTGGAPLFNSFMAYFCPITYILKHNIYFLFPVNRNLQIFCPLHFDMMYKAICNGGLGEGGAAPPETSRQVVPPTARARRGARVVLGVGVG